MIKPLIFLIGLVLFCQCSDKEVMLPVIPEGGIPETQNHSSIWIFYDASAQDSKAVLNKNNKLINTNWIFNIDRRLTMRDVIPILQEMQADRNKDSMHKKEGMANFLSYADSKNERISLVPFPEIKFVRMDDMAGMEDIERAEASSVSKGRSSELDSTQCLVMVRLYEDYVRANGKNLERRDLLEIESTALGCEEGQTVIFRLHYDEEITYQNYLEAKVFLAASQVEVDTTELVETLK